MSCRILYISLFLIVFCAISCHKSDTKIEKKIIGKWAYKPWGKYLPYGPYGTEGKMPELFEVISDNQLIIHSGKFAEATPCDTIPKKDRTYWSTGIILIHPCTTDYFIKDGYLNILVQPDSDVFEYFQFKIDKINNRKLKLVGAKETEENQDYTFTYEREI